jgi:hypothetical protein
MAQIARRIPPQGTKHAPATPPAAPQAEAKPIEGTGEGAVSELFLTPRVLDASGYDEMARQLTEMIDQAKSQGVHLQGLVNNLASADEKLKQTEAQAHGKIVLGQRASRLLEERLVQAEMISRGLTEAVEGADRVGQMVEAMQEDFDTIERTQQERLEAQKERYERAVEALRRTHINQMRALRAEMTSDLNRTAEEVETLQEEMATTLREVRQGFQDEVRLLQREQRGLLSEMEEQIAVVRNETSDSLAQAEQHVLRITAEAVDGAEEAVRGMDERIAAIKLACDAARRSVQALKRLATPATTPATKGARTKSAE